MPRRTQNRGARSGSQHSNDSHDMLAPIHTSITKLRPLADRFLRLGPDHARRLRLTDVFELKQRLHSVLDFLHQLSFPDRIHAALLSFRDGDVGVALLQLVAVGVRQPIALGHSASTAAGTHVAEYVPNFQENFAIANLSVQVVSALLAGSPSPAKSALALKLVRMQTVQACAHQLAEAAEHPMETAEQKVVVNGILLPAATILLALVTYAFRVDNQADPTVSRALTELIAAARDSCVFEHFSRLLMRLIRTCSGAQSEADPSSLALSMLMCYGSMDPFFTQNDSPTPRQYQRLASAFSGPCAAFATMALGLKVLCAADGGPSYGVPAEVWEVLPVLTVTDDGEPEAIAAAGQEQPMLEPRALHALSVMAVLAVKAGRLKERAAVALVCRVCRLAALSAAGEEDPAHTSATAVATGSGGAGTSTAPAVSGADGEAERGVRLSLPPEDNWVLGAGSLSELWNLLEPRAEQLPDEVAEWWRLAVLLMRAKNMERTTYGLGRSIGAIFRTVGGGQEPPPADPPLVVAAALDAGLLPALERLVRRGSADRAGPEARILPPVLGGLGMQGVMGWRFVGPLVSYGEPRQVAALVVSVAKALRRGGDGDVRIMLSLTAMTVLQEVIDCFLRVPTAGAQQQQLPFAGSPERRALVHQLVSLWLPAALQSVLDDECRGSGGEVHRRLVMGCLEAAAKWLPAFVHGAAAAPQSATEGPDGGGGAAAGQRVGASGAGAESAGASSAPGNSDDEDCRNSALSGVESWQHLFRLQELLGPVEPVPTLAAALWMGVNAKATAHACLALASAFPEWVRMETLVAAGSTNQGGTRVPGVGAGGLGGARGRGGGAAGSELPWPPQLLRDAASELRAEGVEIQADGMEALAGLLETWTAGPRTSLEAEAQLYSRVRAAADTTLQAWVPAGRFIAAACSPPFPTCDNPACTRVEGDSELGAKLQQCGRCGAVAYCCRDCQTADWRAGHKAECKQPDGVAKAGMRMETRAGAMAVAALVKGRRTLRGGVEAAKTPQQPQLGLG